MSGPDDTADAVDKVLEMLALFYPQWGQLIRNDVAANFWRNQLSEYDEDALLNGVNQFVRTHTQNHFRPADLHNAIRDVVRKDLGLDPDLIWREIIWSSQQQYPFGDTDTPKLTYPEISLRLVKILGGWKAIADTPDSQYSFLRKRFDDAFQRQTMEGPIEHLPALAVKASESEVGLIDGESVKAIEGAEPEIASKSLSALINELEESRDSFAMAYREANPESQVEIAASRPERFEPVSEEIFARRREAAKARLLMGRRRESERNE